MTSQYYMNHKRDQLAKACMPESKVETFASEMNNYKQLLEAFKTVGVEKSSNTKFNNVLM